MYAEAPEKPSLDGRIRRSIGISLREMYDDQLQAELPPKLATMLERRTLALIAATRRDCEEIAASIERTHEAVTRSLETAHELDRMLASLGQRR
jgi:hypothetical protein